MYRPPAFIKRAEIEEAIQDVQEMAGPDVVRIRYEIGEDGSGEWAIFFRILLTEDAARRRLRKLPRTSFGKLRDANGRMFLP